MKVRTVTTTVITADDKKVTPLEFVEFAKIMFEEEIKNGMEIVGMERNFLGHPSVTLRSEVETKLPAPEVAAAT